MGSPAAGVPGSGGRFPDRAPGSDRGPSVRGPTWSRQLGDERYRVSQAHRPGRRDAGVETAHAPARGGEIELLPLPIVDFQLERFAVDIEGGAGAAGLGDLDLRAADAKLVADADAADIDAARGQVLAQGAVEQRIAARRQGVHYFRRDDQDGFQRAAVDAGVGVQVPLDAERRDPAFGNGSLGQPAGRDVELRDDALHVRTALYVGQASWPVIP